MKNPKRLVIISFGAIGEALMFLALMDVVHREHPSTRFELFTARQGALPQVLGKEYGFIRFSNLKSISGIITALKVMLSETLVLIPPSFGTVPLHIKIFALLLSRLPGSKLVGFKDLSGFHPFSVTRIYDHQTPFFSNLCEALKSAGVSLRNSTPTYRPHPVPDVLARLGFRAGEFVILHPFAANKKRGLPSRRWKSLVEALLRAHPTLPIGITGGKDDVPFAEDIAKHGARSLAGALSLGETAALIQKAGLYVGVDTGITHLASLMRVPSVVIGNRSNPSWLPTYNPNAHILTEVARCGCTGDKKGQCSIIEDGQEYLRCAYDISDVAIVQAVEDALVRRAK